MSVARYYHTASTLANGSILVTGGYNGTFLDSTELYNPSTGNWTTTLKKKSDMNWSCEQVITWCKSFIDDDSILSRFEVIMSSFCCSLCPTNRRFDSFAKMFQHITLYHQNEPNFNITCDLNNACGVLYKTYSAYKAHVYRQHITELHLKNKSNNNSNITSSESEQQEIMNNSSMGLGTNNDDDDI
ncbi:unnamed protein product, partial [Adineta steineri]